MTRFQDLTATDYASVSGEVTIVSDDVLAQMSRTGSYLKLGGDVADITDYHHSLANGSAIVTWHFQVQQAGPYRFVFHYNNPGLKMGGHRNIRDERNCRVEIDDEWVGWLIFNVSGYLENSSGQPQQTLATIGGNQEWNQNFLDVYLEAGTHLLSLDIEAPPEQAVYGGPNLDWIEIVEGEPLLPLNQLPIKGDAFVHPGITVTRPLLEQLKQNIKVPNSISQKGLQELLASPLASLDYEPSPVKQIDVGPYNNPNIGGRQWTQDNCAAWYHALLYTITGKKVHGQKVIEILNAWANTLEEVSEGNDLMLRFSLVGIDFVNAAEIIRHIYNNDEQVAANERWSDADQATFEEFLISKIVNKTKGFYPQANGNWDALIGAFNCAAAIFLEDYELFNRSIRQFVRGDVLGGPCLSMGSLSHYLYATGESQESNRDQTHALMGLTGLARLAWFAKNQGLNLFDLYDTRLLVGALYNAKYQLGEAAPSQTFISDRGRGSASCAAEVFEILTSYCAEKNKEERGIFAQAADKLLHYQRVLNEAQQPCQYLFGMVYGVTEGE